VSSESGYNAIGAISCSNSSALIGGLSAVAGAVAAGIGFAGAAPDGVVFGGAAPRAVPGRAVVTMAAVMAATAMK
jgi:hypothetical protein